MSRGATSKSVIALEDFKGFGKEKPNTFHVHNYGVQRKRSGSYCIAEYRERRQFFKQRAERNENNYKKNEDDSESISVTSSFLHAGDIDIVDQLPVYSNSASVRALAVLIFCTVFGMCTWFSASAVLPQMMRLYGIGHGEGTLLTLGVNFGFLFGVLGSVMTKIADRVPPSRLVTVGSGIAALLNAALLLPNVNFGWALLLRVLTGAAMALVYPMACKVAATWFSRNRGVAMGCVVGSVGLGSASPQLVNALFEVGWREVVLACSILSGAASLLALLVLKEGPYWRRAEGVDAGNNDQKSEVSLVIQNRAFWLCTLGYSGHNWELYALWLWFKKFANDSGLGEYLIPSSNDDTGRGASMAAFMVISCGFFGSIVAGAMADKFGRTSVCLVALLVSIIGSLAIGWCEAPELILVMGLAWGAFAASESAQYSAMTTEVVDPSVIGNAVTIQFGVGFLLTMPGMWIVPSIAADGGNWALAWSTLTPGPIIGALAMFLLRRTPEAKRAAVERGRPAF